MKFMKAIFAVNIFAMALDFIGAIILALYALLIGPLGILRGPIAMERYTWYFWVLLPQGLMTRSIRTAIDWRLGNFDAAIAQLESLVGSNEEYYKEKPGSRARKRVLEDLYTVLARAYLHAGHIDDAMLVVIRAKKSMGIDRLGGLAELDAKTAHLVRAGLAAGRLLDGSGLATMFVKSNQEEPKERRSKSRSPRRQGASKAPPPGEHDPFEDEKHQGGKVIPFPSSKKMGTDPTLP